jgi:hypothetical protein
MTLGWKGLSGTNTLAYWAHLEHTRKNKWSLSQILDLTEKTVKDKRSSLFLKKVNDGEEKKFHKIATRSKKVFSI